MQIEIVEEPTQPHEFSGYLLGTVRINGSLHHFECIRVSYDEGAGMLCAVDGDDEDNESRLDDLANACGGMPTSTIEIDGQEGEWLVHITPYG